MNLLLFITPEILAPVILAVSIGGAISLGNLILRFIDKKYYGLIYWNDENRPDPDKLKIKSFRIYLIPPDEKKTQVGVMLNFLIKGLIFASIVGMFFLGLQVFFPDW